MHTEPSSIEKGLEESCRKLEEVVAIERKSNERNKTIIQSLEKELKENYHEGI